MDWIFSELILFLVTSDSVLLPKNFFLNCVESFRSLETFFSKSRRSLIISSYFETIDKILDWAILGVGMVLNHLTGSLAFMYIHFITPSPIRSQQIGNKGGCCKMMQFWTNQKAGKIKQRLMLSRPRNSRSYLFFNDIYSDCPPIVFEFIIQIDLFSVSNKMSKIVFKKKREELFLIG